MQFNQHLEKTLLVPVAAEPKQVLQKTSSETGNRGTPPVASAVGGAGGGMQGNLLKGIDNKTVKGQLFSKCHFGIFNFAKKHAKKFDLTTKGQ